MHSFNRSLLAVCAAAGWLASPVLATPTQSTALPVLKLDYGSFRATAYDKARDVHPPFPRRQSNSTNIPTQIYTFKNIRFGAPATGDLRWAPPQKPAVNNTIQDGKYGPSCPQTAMPGFPGDPNTVANLVWGGASEDCLFLNLYVPGKALKDPSTKLPVIVSLYGGAYVLGSKEMNDGLGLLHQSGNSAIVVIGNYRIGPLGFLTGATMEKEATPNVGLHDQIAVFEWVQKYSNLFGGNKEDVSAWGESAGGGSIYLHLILEGGKRDPLFKKAVIQSPAVNQLFDRRGTLEDTYKRFESLLGCTGKGVACLRKVPLAKINEVGGKMNKETAAATFAFGPQPDGKLIRQLPALEYASGNVWKGLQSVISSHTSDEGKMFVEKTINNPAAFDTWMRKLYPKSVIDAGWPAKITKMYPDTPKSSDRFKDYVRDNIFSCNARWIAEAYPGKTYAMQYSAGGGTHGADIDPTYYNGPKSFLGVTASSENQMYRTYQSYLISHAKTGNPNTSKKVAALEWPPVNAGSELAFPVLDVADKTFSLVKDSQNSKSRCDFLRAFWKETSEAAGYKL
jgi:carboxylesterase type B